METWVTKTFGGDRLVLVPTPTAANHSAPPGHLLAQDPVSKLWVWGGRLGRERPHDAALRV
jgi:hypothetical protein